MKSFDQPPEPGAEEQAALWAARLDGGSLGAPERAELAAWLAAEPARESLLAGYRQISARLDIQLPALLDAVDLTAPVTNPAARRRIGPVWAAAAALAAAAGIALVVWLTRPAARVEEIATPAGRRQAVTLADGTRVELNARTAIRFEDGAAERHATLAAGEVFFIVKKDPARPFIVETPAGSVRVTGTAFDVRTENASELEVTVVEGHVQVRPVEAGGSEAPAPRLLGAADRLSARAGAVTVEALPAGPLADALAWREGKIVFRGATLREALAGFADYNGRIITATDAAAATVRGGIGGRYSLDDLEGFLAALQETWPLRVSETPGGAVRVSLRTEP